ncbi:Mobile element protein [Candidatus Burkholderia crenata]|nr:Mobile element protein [Candidatus Burkholderia crenata]
MIKNDLSFLPLRVTRVGAGGKRSFDPADKQRLIDACLEPGASLSGLALKAGVNANQLHKWVRLREQSNAAVRGNVALAPSAFMAVVAIDDTVPVPISSPAAPRVSLPEPEPSRLSPRSGASARLSAQLSNGVKLELACSGEDGALVVSDRSGTANGESFLTDG